MAEVTLEFISQQLQRVLHEQRGIRHDIGDMKADLEVAAAIVRRLDHSVQNLTGEVRALAGQQDRQRQKLDRLAKELRPEPH